MTRTMTFGEWRACLVAEISPLLKKLKTTEKQAEEARAAAEDAVREIESEIEAARHDAWLRAGKPDNIDPDLPSTLIEWELAWLKRMEAET